MERSCKAFVAYVKDSNSKNYDFVTTIVIRLILAS